MATGQTPASSPPFGIYQDNFHGTIVYNGHNIPALRYASVSTTTWQGETELSGLHGVEYTKVGPISGAYGLETNYPLILYYLGLWFALPHGYATGPKVIYSLAPYSDFNGTVSENPYLFGCTYASNTGSSTKNFLVNAIGQTRPWTSNNTRPTGGVDNTTPFYYPFGAKFSIASPTPNQTNNYANNHKLLLMGYECERPSTFGDSPIGNPDYVKPSRWKKFIAKISFRNKAQQSG